MSISKTGDCVSDAGQLDRLPPSGENGKRCSQCSSYLPASFLFVRGRKTLCRSCSTTLSFCSAPRKRGVSWAAFLVSTSRFECRKMFRLHFRVKVEDVENLPSALEYGDYSGRLMPFDLSAVEMNSFNTCIVHKEVAAMLRKCIRSANMGLYHCIISYYFPGYVPRTANKSN